MAKKKRAYKIDEAGINALIRKGELTSELDLQRASIAARFLRLQTREHPEFEALEEKLGELIRKYESVYWSDIHVVTDEQVKENESAETQAFAEFAFFKQRKDLILKNMKREGLKQSDLGFVLSHGKSYISELLNNIRPFSTNDLIIIHQLLNIPLDQLFFTEIPSATLEKIAIIRKKMQAEISEAGRFKRKSLPASISRTP